MTHVKNPTGTRRWSRTQTLSAALVLALGASAAAPTVADAASAVQNPSVDIVGLKAGDRGDGVRYVQERLLSFGFVVAGGADGIFGDGTERALKSFQRVNGLEESGVVTAPTARYLAMGSGSSPSSSSSSNSSSSSSSGVASGDTIVGLQLGHRGEGVRRVQERLLHFGYSVSGGADGIFGSGTERAVKSFQRDNGLEQSGTVTAKTAQALGLSGGASGVASAPGTSSATSGRSSGTIEGLQRGHSGDDVELLQTRLTNTGLVLQGGIDGIFGPGTEHAVKLVQRVNGLSETGVVDAATARAINASGGNASAPVASAPAGSTIAQGARGNSVIEIQSQLIAAGVPLSGGADGIFGPSTEQAVKTFQRNQGLPVTGVVDTATRQALAAPRSSSGGTASNAASTQFVGLKEGSSGAVVKKLQEQLMATGLTVRGGADGVFGPGTKSALIRFQEINGITADGVVNATTAQLLGLGSSSSSGSTSSGSTSSATAGYPVYDERGARVRALQTALINAGISVPGGADGAFGSGTLGAVVAFQKSKGINPTGKVDKATADALGLSPTEPPAAPTYNDSSIVLQARPVAGACWYGDTWQSARGGGRAHLGVDIGSKEGTPLRAVVSGRITHVYYDKPGSLSGNALRLTMSDGTYYFYAHLAGFADGIGVGVPVEAGQVIGTMGKTGNANNTPHLHLEIHPGGGPAINPYPVVKQYGACG